MTTTTAKKIATPARKAREKVLHEQALAERLRRSATRARATNLPRRADELYTLLRTIQKRSGELFDLVHKALDADNAAWLELYGTQREVDCVMVDFIATPRDLNMLLCAVESNTPFRKVKGGDEG